MRRQRQELPSLRESSQLPLQLLGNQLGGGLSRMRSTGPLEAGQNGSPQRLEQKRREREQVPMTSLEWLKLLAVVLFYVLLFIYTPEEE